MCVIEIKCSHSKNPKIYVCLLEEKPEGLIVHELKNEIGPINWSIDGVGEYYANSNNLFTKNKTAVYVTPNEGSFSCGGYSDFENKVYVSATNMDGIYESNFRNSNITVKIEVYS